VLPLFQLFPQQPRASNEAQDFGRAGVKVVTWFHKGIRVGNFLEEIALYSHSEPSFFNALI
jgi:hypothetical protein